MPEIQIPENLEHDCGNCQGLCCVALHHRPEDNFPILNTKPGGEACHNLETNPADQTKLFRCRIHESLKEKGWTTCDNFTCFGAGQAVSKFFSELGINWALGKPADMDDDKWKIMTTNLYVTYSMFDDLFELLYSFKYSEHPLSEEAYLVAREAIKDAAAQLAITLQRGVTVIKAHFWLEEIFKPAIMEAVHNYAAQNAPQYLRN